MISQAFKPRGGVSLLEIIVATVILAVAVVSIAGMIGYTHKSTAKDFRNLTAIQLLESTMRSSLAADYKFLTTGLHNEPISLGTYTMPLGVIATESARFNVSLQVSYEPVSFGYMPIKISDQGFVATQPSTWQFEPQTTCDFNLPDVGSANAYRIKKLIGSVEWEEPERKLQRTIHMVSYVAEYSE